MGWESRKGRGHYYLRTIREGKQFRREYVGTGPLAEQAAALDAFVRERRRAAVTDRRARDAQRRDVHRAVREYLRDTLVLLRAWATLHGRVFRVRTPRKRTMNQPLPAQISVADLPALLDRVDAGDPEAQALLIEWAQRTPGLWEEAAAWEERATVRLLDLAAGMEIAEREAIRQRLEARKAELGWESADPAQRMLIDRAVLSWLYLTTLDQLLARAIGNDLVEAKPLERLRARAEKTHREAVQLLQRPPIGRRRRSPQR